LAAARWCRAVPFVFFLYWRRAFFAPLAGRDIRISLRLIV